MSAHWTQLFIGGAWVEPAEGRTLPVVDPATEEAFATVAAGSRADVDRAVGAAAEAFGAYSESTREDRLALLDRIVEVYERRAPDLAQVLSQEMGAPAGLAAKAQVPSGLAHFVEVRRVLESYPFEELRGRTMIRREPAGVCALITPWNWPLNQIAAKVAPALAAGCTMVLKPSEVAPLNAVLFAEVLEEAGVPRGVFNLVQGTGPTVGAALAAHPRVEMVSFTGSTRGGIAVAHAAADSVKRVHQELGGKSANIVLDDADLGRAVKHGVRSVMVNSGQSCNAGTRLLVPADRQEEIVDLARAVLDKVTVGPPDAKGTVIGPVVSEAQFDKVQGLIQQGIDEGARLVAGGRGRPEGLERGYYVRPTLFADVTNRMAIAREEIFGPVLSIMPYEGEDEAIAIANDSPYGLSGYVSSGDLERARRVAAKLRTGGVHLNGAPLDNAAPFGGYKQSGNGREWGRFGFEEYLEVKAVMGYAGQ